MGWALKTFYIYILKYNYKIIESFKLGKNYCIIYISHNNTCTYSLLLTSEGSKLFSGYLPDFYVS